MASNPPGSAADPLTGFIVAVVSLILLIEVPWTIAAAARIVKRYRVRIVDSTIFRLLTKAVIEIAAMGAIVGFLTLYGASRALFPDDVPQLPTGVFVMLLGLTLIVFLRLPIVIDREMARRARDYGREVEINEE